MKPMSSGTRRTILIIAGCVVCLVLGGAIGSAIGIHTSKPDSDEQFILDEYHTLEDEWLFADDDFNYNAAAGIASGVAEEKGDSFTFLTPDKESQGLSTTGKGFGISTRFYDGGLYVTQVQSDSSSERQGILAGDLIYQVDDTSFESLSYDTLSSFLSSLDEEEHIFLIRRGDKNLSFRLKKDTYSLKCLDILQTPNESNNGTLTVRISSFLGNSALALEGTLKAYEGKVKKLVIDLRENGGGYVSQACSLAKLFVKKDTLLYLFKDKNGNTMESQYQEYDPEFTIDDYSIILDSNSASASELFTLSMRAGTNAKVYGFTSYGKGIAQYTKTFSNGATLRYTAAYVYGPERENETMYDEGSDSDKIMCIHGKGIIPDVTYDRNYQFLNYQIRYADTYGISDSYMNFMNRVVSYTRPELYQEYSSTHTFHDLITDYAAVMSDSYSTEIKPFNDDGTITKAFNDKYLKESYDTYLTEYEKLTELSEENQ